MDAIPDILLKDQLSEDDLCALLSEAAAVYLEPMAQKAQEITLRHFGRVVTLYAPLYLSNYCENECVYCGFSRAHAVTRKKLTLEELEAEAEVLTRSGIQHILLLTGESRTQSPLSYIRECVAFLRGRFSSISVEIYPLQTAEYRELIAAGADGLTIYQETYDEELYSALHKAGPKRDYRFRLGAPERGCQAGMRQVSVGALLGLSDWRQEALRVGLHARFLQRSFPDVEVGISLPRLKGRTGDFSALYPVSDREFVQILLALRLFLPRAGISLSTREPRLLRENLIGLGVTRMSAGSHTEVGGYASPEKSGGQFEIADLSSVDDVKEMITRKGYQPVLKDWQFI